MTSKKTTAGQSGLCPKALLLNLFGEKCRLDNTTGIRYLGVSRQ